MSIDAPPNSLAVINIRGGPVTFFDGGIFAKSLTGNAEGHINLLHDRDICSATTPQRGFVDLRASPP